MATVINGILTQRFALAAGAAGRIPGDWHRVSGVRSLSFAVGSYISIATTMAMFAGGLLRWLVERGAAKKERCRE